MNRVGRFQMKHLTIGFLTIIFFLLSMTSLRFLLLSVIKCDVRNNKLPAVFARKDKKKNLSVPLYYPWFFRNESALSLYGPNNTTVKMEKLGQFHASKGEQVFHYSIQLAGTYQLKHGSSILEEFSTHPEKCFCPENMKSFRERFQCNSEDNKVLDDFMSRWLPKSIPLKEFEDSKGFSTRRKKIQIRASIIDNVMYVSRNSSPPNDMRLPMFNEFMQSLLRKVRIPNVEFYHMFGDDFPTSTIEAPSPPIISQGCNENFADIPAPTSHQLAWMLNGSAVRYAASSPPWREKKPVAYFRGSRTGSNIGDVRYLKYNARTKLAMVAKGVPSVDAKVLREKPRFRNYHSEEQEAKIQKFYTERGIAEEELDPEDEGKKYKFIISPDGNVSPWRNYYQVALGSVLMPQSSPHKEWWYGHLLKDRQNMVRLKRYFQDLPQSVDWLLENDREAEEIARNAFSMWKERLREEDAYCWMAELLHKLEGKLAFKPAVRPGMTSLDEHFPHDMHCSCQFGSNKVGKM